jgi:hypothetical protein
MENLDLIILSSILVVSFIVFIIATIRELKNIDTKKTVFGKESGPRAKMISIVGNLFDSEHVIKEEERIYNAIQRTISDMESDGIRFPEEIKNEFEKRREDMVCNYSGLPSVNSY